MRRAWLLGLLFLLGGCPSGPADPMLSPEMLCESATPPPGGAPTAELGVAMDGPFVPLDGQTVPYYSGPQGGQHLYLTIRLYGGAGAAYWPTDLHITDGAGAERGRNTEYLRPCTGRWSMNRFLRVFLDRPGAIPDATITLSAMPEGGTAEPLKARARVQVIDR
jgi:hypothetical protein